MPLLCAMYLLMSILLISMLRRVATHDSGWASPVCMQQLGLLSWVFTARLCVSSRYAVSCIALRGSQACLVNVHHLLHHVYGCASSCRCVDCFLLVVVILGIVCCRPATGACIHYYVVSVCCTLHM